MSSLPKPFVPITEEQITIAELFVALPYDQQAEVFRQLSVLFDEAMEIQRYEQHRDKINGIKIEKLEPGLHRLTNVHGNVYIAQYDTQEYEKWGSEAHHVWKEGHTDSKVYLRGGLENVCERVCNL